MGATRPPETNRGLNATHSFLHNPPIVSMRSGIWAGLGRAEEITLLCCGHLSDFNKSLALLWPENICLNVSTICEGAVISERKK